ncbi:MAG TPA: DCC1-like thiol-disulfide oxidoreductase family protein [Membranihabitans sp.]|nr:DCC1-like thiol-disulfide oxidoreductase family protein [Membranihabitans sp.]
MEKHTDTVSKFDTQDYPILLFDSYCLICNGFVQWIIRRDKRNVFKFSGLQSERAIGEITRRNLILPKNDTVILLYPHQSLIQSEAVLEVLQVIGFPAFLLHILGKIPRTWRDYIYSLVARYRFSIFPKRTSCPLPSPSESHRFI